MPEVRFSTPKKLDDRVREVANSLGVDKSAYIKSLVLKDLKKYKRKNA